MASGPSMRDLPNAPIRGAQRPGTAGGYGGGYAETVISTTTAAAPTQLTTRPY